MAEWHSIYTIQLGELIEADEFTWSMVDWGGMGGYTEDFQKAFETRYYYSEISMLPPSHWMKMLEYDLKYEIAPKYLPLLKELEGQSYLQSEGEYEKTREIASTYPETLLDNTDEAYASTGKDFEREKVKTGDVLEKLQGAKRVKSIFGLALDELEKLFIGLYTTHINGF